MEYKECENSLFYKSNLLALAFPSYSFNIGKIGGWGRTNYQPCWGSIFITTPNGIQIGRLIFKDGFFDHSKVYGNIPNPIWQLLENFVTRS